ncbi:MAG: hypothetical protein JNM10_11535 [Planctomycetia bacterium]|nr:hypothetical protein [Planctomycetia bacterium]
MRGDLVYRVYGVHAGRAEDSSFGTYRTRAEAEAEIARLSTCEMDGENWARRRHDRGFVVREIVVETDFEVPPRPKPRDRYVVRGTPKPNAPGRWDSTVVEVLRRVGDAGGLEPVATYERNYRMLDTFEPFRQGDREFALIAPRYTGASVLDLATGRVIAEEPYEASGFCPFGFYVPDWWDLYDGRVFPGSESWGPDHEWVSGGFGFVWGCLWGDDTHWKVQFLDLTDVRSGVIRRDERFGYVELMTKGYRSPCFSPETAPPAGGSAPPPFVRVVRDGGSTEVQFIVPMRFDLASGRPKEWQRLRIENLE